MLVLGITDSITSGAAIVIDGRVSAAINEERLDRNKMCMGFPRRSIFEVMRVAGVSAGDIDAVAVATNDLFWRSHTYPYQDPYRESHGDLRDIFLGLGAGFATIVGNSSFARRRYHGLKSLLTRKRRHLVREVLRREYGIKAVVDFVDHHICHAASAYFTSGFENATIITHDGAGDGKCSRVVRVRRGEFEPLHSLSAYDSVGNYYAYVTHLCGYEAHKHEGKITGLAAYGEAAYLNVLRQFVNWDGPNIYNVGKCFGRSAVRKLERQLPGGFSNEDLSASAQALLENSVAAYAEYWVTESGVSNVALAGGVFANVKLNQRIHQLDVVDNMFVHPAMGDDGLAVGAALFEHNRRAGFVLQEPMQHVYLGPGYTDGEVLSAIAEEERVVEFTPDEGRARAVARLLAEGKIVARSSGRMEYGPRSLGNRTIMYQTTDPTVNDWLNKKLSRTEFMPFAPVTLWEHRYACYENIDGAENTACFMTITFDCTDEMKSQSPAVTHVDGTARPQLIKKEANPEYYAILEAYEALTGIPSLINTSFNMHEEPIVNTPRESITAFLSSGLDALILGKRIVLPAGTPARESRERVLTRSTASELAKRH